MKTISTIRPLLFAVFISFVTAQLQGQTTETFETESVASTTFTDNGQTFNILNNSYDILSFAGGGWNGSIADNQFIDNSGATSVGTGSQFSIETNDGTDIYIIDLYTFCSTSALAAHSGTISFTGYQDGVMIYSFTKSAGFANPVTLSPNNGFTFIDFATEGASDFSDDAIDSLSIVSTGNLDYIALDAFQWDFAPLPCAMTASITAQTNVSCNGGTSGSLTVTESGGTANFTYSWSNGSTTSGTASSTNTNSSLAASTYTVTVTDGNGCTATTSATITQPSAVGASITAQTNASCNGVSDGSLTASGSGGTGAYTYSWSNGATTAATSSLSAATYTVTITDANGCTASTSATITEPAALVASTVLDNNVSCNGLSDGGSTASATGGTTPFTYSWNTGATSASITAVGANNYYVTITDANGCTDSASVTVSEPAALVAFGVVDSNASCNGFLDGGATASAIGGTMPFTYSWNNAATNASITGVGANSYYVTITDANGCTDSASVTIGEPAALVATITPQNVQCNGLADGGATANASGGNAPYSYLWSNGPTTAANTNLVAGTYTVTITDANGCTDTETSTLTQPAVLSIGFTVTDNICFGGTAGSIVSSVTGGSAPFSYTWSNTSTVANINNLSAATYTLTVTDNNGCTSVNSAIVSERPDLVVTLVNTDNVCGGDSAGAVGATITGGTSPYTYNWSEGTSGTGATPIITNLVAATYTVTITDAFGCTRINSSVVSEPTPLSLGFTKTDVICFGDSSGSIITSIGGGTSPYTYNWSNGDTIQNINNIPASTYTLTVTDNVGCTIVDSTTLTERPQLVISVGGTNNNCAGDNAGTATVNISGGTSSYSYMWSEGTNGSGATSTISMLLSGTYTVTVTDAFSCMQIDSVSITEPTALALSINSYNVSCNAAADGSAKANVSGGTSPYTYVWSTTAGTDSISSLVPGLYSVTVTDNNGCTSVSSATITEPVPVVVVITVDSNVSVFGASDGGMTAAASMGIAPYSYSWSNGPSTASNQGIPAGTYTVTVTDANGCSASSSASISQPTAINVTVNSTDVSCNGANDGSATAVPSGGVTPYAFLWNTSATSASITNLAPGTYTVTVSDNNGATEIDSAVISQPSALSAAVSLDSNASCLATADGGLTCAASGGTAPYTYSWSNAASTPSVSGLTAGVYTVTVTDNNGCTTTANGIINVDDNNKPNAIAKNITVYLNPSGMATISGADIDNGSTDDCAIASLRASPENFDCNDEGGNFVRLIVVDSNGNRDTANSTVTVLDTLAPTMNSRNISLILDSARGGTIVTADIDNGSNDACGLDTLYLSQYSFNCADTGLNVIWLYGLDNNGNMDSVTASVTVVDTVGAAIIAAADSACETYTWTQNGMTYTSSGIYIDTLMNGLGCDSIYYTLDLTINNATAAVDTQTACDSLVWIDGITYFSNNNTAMFTISNTAGCDSVVTLDLTIIQSTESTEQQMACGSYTWPQNGQTYTSTGMYTAIITNAVGCDSVITLDLEIRPLSLAVINLGDTLFAFENHPQATYQWYDCVGDSAITGATGKGFSPDTAGFFSVIVGNGLCTDTSACQEVVIIGVEELISEETELNIYPNPTSEDFYFEIDRMGEDGQLYIYDMGGNLVLQKSVLRLKEKIETDDWNAGIYFLRYNEEVRKIVVTR